MEASGMSQAAPADTGGQAEGEGTAPQQGGTDLSALETMLKDQASASEELRQFIMAEPWKQEADQAEVTQDPALELDPAYADPYSPDFDAQTVAAQVQQFAQQQAQQLAEQQIAPLREEVAYMRMEQEARDLSTEFPELRDPEVAKGVLQQAQQWAETVGQPQLAQMPQFWKLVYLGGTTVGRANSEGGQTPSVANLEGGGGAGPASGQQADPLAEIMGARRTSPLPF